jgi:hypothetical protein
VPTEVYVALGNAGLLHPENSPGCNRYYERYHLNEITRVKEPTDFAHTFIMEPSVERERGENGMKGETVKNEKTATSSLCLQPLA